MWAARLAQVEPPTRAEQPLWEARPARGARVARPDCPSAVVRVSTRRPAGNTVARAATCALRDCTVPRANVSATWNRARVAVMAMFATMSPPRHPRSAASEALRADPARATRSARTERAAASRGCPGVPTRASTNKPTTATVVVAGRCARPRFRPLQPRAPRAGVSSRLPQGRRAPASALCTVVACTGRILGRMPTPSWTAR